MLMRNNFESMSINDRRSWFDKADELRKIYRSELYHKSNDTYAKSDATSKYKLFSLNGKRKRNQDDYGFGHDEFFMQ